jgi:uncharacterized iron-regulated membrane protein
MNAKIVLCTFALFAVAYLAAGAVLWIKRTGRGLRGKR